MNSPICHIKGVIFIMVVYTHFRPCKWIPCAFRSFWAVAFVTIGLHKKNGEIEMKYPPFSGVDPFLFHRKLKLSGMIVFLDEGISSSRQCTLRRSVKSLARCEWRRPIVVATESYQSTNFNSAWICGCLDLKAYTETLKLRVYYSKDNQHKISRAHKALIAVPRAVYL